MTQKLDCYLHLWTWSYCVCNTMNEPFKALGL